MGFSLSVKDLMTAVLGSVLISLWLGWGKWKTNILGKNRIFFLSHLEWNPQLGMCMMGPKLK